MFSQDLSRNRISNNPFDVEQHSVNDNPRWTTNNQGSDTNGVAYYSLAHTNQAANTNKNWREYRGGTHQETEPPSNLTVQNKVSLFYETAFKKPLFLKDNNSVFDDDLAAFKDESSPNLLSTNASSLSSLTIDDDDDDVTTIQNRTNFINTSKTQKSVLRQWQQNLTDYASESSPIQEISCARSKSDWNLHNVKEYSYHGKIDAQYKTDVHNQKLYAQERRSFERERPTEKDKEVKFRYVCDSCKCAVKGSNCRQKQELSIKQKNYYHSDENNDRLVYEEQLLDQCIRQGMAKVTKRCINDIKPFCWDLNHICLTTRVMLKTADDDILKGRNFHCKQRVTMSMIPAKLSLINTKTK